MSGSRTPSPPSPRPRACRSGSCTRPRSPTGSRGSAELVVEVRSEGDESYRKPEFYAALGVREVLALHPAPRAVELFRLVDDRYVVVSPDAAGTVLSQVLDLRPGVEGAHLRLTWDGGCADV